MAIKDLRGWLEQVEEIGELRRVEGANWQEEIGALTDIYAERVGRPALLFDKVPSFPEGYRVLSNVGTSLRRIALMLGLPADSKALDIVRFWRQYSSKMETLPPKFVERGPILENVDLGEKVDLLKFPTPRWRELDGGRYIGTGCAVITKDPDSDWVNLGCYRDMIHDRNTVGLQITQGKHGYTMLHKYWDRGQPCPVAVSFGHDPLIYLIAGMEIPYGVGEYGVCGALRGEPVEVIPGPVTGLPIPANAEIVIEGECPPQGLKVEGPFGEWMGYFAGGEQREPYINVKSVLYRNDPIILSAIPGVPPSDNTYYGSFLRSAGVWDELEKAGVPGIKGVWLPEPGGARLITIVSIQQMYPGHSRQAGLIASQCHAGIYANRLVIVVDEDIDPTNMDEVLWALCTRADPMEDIEIIRKCWSSPRDPISYPLDARVFNSRAIIDACRPWERRDDFPPVARCSAELRRKTLEKWAKLRVDLGG